MRNYYGKAEPKYFALILVVAFIIAVGVIGHIWMQYSKAMNTKSNPIGQYNNRTMFEKIDKEADIGKLPMFMAYGFTPDGVRGEEGDSGCKAMYITSNNSQVCIPKDQVVNVNISKITITVRNVTGSGPIGFEK